MYSKYYNTMDLDKTFIETYINTLKKCKDMGHQQPLTRERSTQDFDDFFTKLVQIKNSNDNIFEIIWQQAFHEILVIIDLLGQSHRIEERVASIIAYKIIIDKFEDKDLEVLYLSI